MSKPSFYDDLKIPAIAAPLFLVLGPKLVIECCKSGIVGTFPALNQRTTKGFEEWVIQIKDELAEFEKETGKKTAPFGVNLTNGDAPILTVMVSVVLEVIAVAIPATGSVARG